MAFFNDYQKCIARKYKTAELKKKYRESEKLLKRASQTGSDSMLAKAMETHRTLEYALLYQNTPEFKYKFARRSKNANGKF